jgi:hypothetical protein
VWLEAFFERCNGALGLGVVLRPSRKLAQPHAAQHTAQRLRRDGDLELFPESLAEISDAPAHYAMDGRCRATLDDVQQRGAIRLVVMSQAVV